jgi:hypothetical protein
MKQDKEKKNLWKRNLIKTHVHTVQIKLDFPVSLRFIRLLGYDIIAQ